MTEWRWEVWPTAEDRARWRSTYRWREGDPYPEDEGGHPLGPHAWRWCSADDCQKPIPWHRSTAARYCSSTCKERVAKRTKRRRSRLRATPARFEVRP
jgi:predicted nucleic acid-binding Zn ribbon protein